MEKESRDRKVVKVSIQEENDCPTQVITAVDIVEISSDTDEGYSSTRFP
jgi:hypothetical protein